MADNRCHDRSKSLSNLSPESTMQFCAVDAIFENYRSDNFEAQWNLCVSQNVSNVCFLLPQLLRCTCPLLTSAFTTTNPIHVGYLNHTQFALVMFSQLSAAVARHKANDGIVYAIRAWFKYDTALSAVV